MREWMEKRRRQAGDDGGFTLVEVLIVIVVMSMVLGAIVTAFELTARSSLAAKERVKRSNDAQFITSFLVRDAASAGGYDEQNEEVDASVATPGVFNRIGSTDGFCDDMQSVLRLEWVERPVARAPGDPTSVRIAVNYALRNNELVRTRCEKAPASPGAGGTTSAATIGRHVDSATVSCQPTCPEGARAPQSTVIVTLNVIEQASNTTGERYSFSASGFLRAGGRDSTATSDLVPLIVMGAPTTGNCTQSTNPNASGIGVASRVTTGQTSQRDPWAPAINVYGIAAVNSRAGTSGAPCGPALNLLGGSTGYNATNTLVREPGACNSGGCEPNEYIPIPSDIPDPYIDTPRPRINTACSTSGTNPNRPNDGSTTDRTVTLQPGIYHQTLRLEINNGNEDTQFIFGSGAARNNETDAGVYVFCQGIELCSGMQFDSAAGGVLLYFSDGPGSGPNNTIRPGTGSSCDGYQDYTAHMSGRPEFNNIVIWQRGTPSTPLTIPTGDNNLPSGSSANYDGVIYAPASKVQFYIPPNANEFQTPNDEDSNNDGWPDLPIEATVRGLVARNVVALRDARVRIGPGPQTTTTLTASPNPANVGQQVTLQATVRAVAPATGIPTGFVQFFDDIESLGFAPINGAGVATLVATSIRGGARPLTAVYGGDSNYASSVSPTLNQVNNPATATLALSSSPNPSGAGQSARFRVQLSPSGPPVSGNVALYQGQTLLGATSQWTGNVANIDVTFNTIGVRSVYAVYDGDASYSQATSPTIQHDVRQPATIAMTATPTSATASRPVTLRATVAALSGPIQPSGTVTFYDNGSPIFGGSVILVNGVAQMDVTTLTVGSHQLTAVYSGDATFATVTSAPPITVNVSTAVPTIALVINPTSASSGTPVTMTATLTAPTGGVPPFPVPTGTVRFLDRSNGDVQVGATATVNASGVATMSVSNLSSGNHNIVAVYDPAAVYASVTSNQVSVNIGRSVVLTLVSPSGPGPYPWNTSFDFDVDMDPVPPLTGQFWQSDRRGTVELFRAVPGTDPDFDSDPIDSNGHGDLQSGSLPPGTYEFYARWTARDGSDTAISNTITVIVSDSRTLTLRLLSPSDGGPYFVGTNFEFDADLSPVPGGNQTARGTVRLYRGNGIELDSDAVDSSGDVDLFDVLPVGTHDIYAVWTGASSGSPTTSNIITVVVSSSRLLTLSKTSPSGNGPFQAGTEFDFDAVVSPAPGGNSSSRGSVTLYRGNGIFVASGSVPSNTNGRVDLDNIDLPAGTHNLYAEWSGNTTGSPATSNIVTIVVNGNPTSTALAISPGGSSYNYGQTLTFTASVSENSFGTPGGTVRFYDGATEIGSANLTGPSNNRTAAITVNDLSVGTHTQLRAVYEGDAAFNGSTSSSLTRTINPTSTSLSLASSGTTVFGQQVSITATVSPSNAAGSVTFYEGATVLGVVGVSGGQAQLSLGSLSVGSHTINAVFTGDGGFNNSTSANITRTVNRANTTVSLVRQGGSGSVQPGQSVTFVATVSTSGPGSGTPTGNVAFVVDNVAQPVTLLNGSGQATFTTSFPTAGTRTIRVDYAGSANHNASASGNLTVVVSNDPVITGISPSSVSRNSNRVITITGSSFIGTPTVSFSAGSDCPFFFTNGISGIRIVSSSTTQIQVEFDVSSGFGGASRCYRDVTVSVSNGTVTADNGVDIN